jgi:hypothetical protein
MGKIAAVEAGKIGGLAIKTVLMMMFLKLSEILRINQITGRR